MIGQFLDKLDDKLYIDWQKNAKSLSAQLKIGFNNIDFDKDKHPELDSIRSSLEAISDPDKLNRQDYVQHIRNIKEKLEQLATNKEFDNIAFNNFILQARRSFNWLMMRLFSDYHRYADAAFNPSGKEKKPPKSNVIQKAAMNLGANYAASNLYSRFEENVLVFMRMQAEHIQRQPKIHIKDAIDFTQSAKPLSLIELRVGKDRFSELDSTLEIKQPEDVTQYLGEQIYGLMFKSMYSQIALQEETLTKIDKLSEVGKSSAEIKKERERLLHEAGLEEIDSTEARAYRNKIAKLLGFNDAKDLFENFQYLDTDSEFGTFKQLINEFMSNANKAIMAEDDPLEQIKNEIEKENERVKQNLDDPDFSKNSINYINLANYNATNLMLTLVVSQSGKNIAQLAAKDYMDPKKLVGDNPGLMAQMAMKAADLAINRFNYKKYFDTYALARLHKDTEILERRLRDINRPINHQWLIGRSQEIQAKYAMREQVIQNALSKNLDDDSFTAEYVDVMYQYQLALLEHDKIRHLPVHDPVFIEKAKSFREKQDTYKNYKDAFSLFANSKMSRLSVTQLDDYIKQKNQKIKVVSEKHKNQIDAVDVLNKEIKKEEKRLKTTFRGRLQRFGEKIAGLFGFKTKSVKGREAKQKNLEDLQAQLDPIKQEFDIETNLLNRAIEQKGMIEQFQKLEISELNDNVLTLTYEYLTTYQMLQNDFEQLAVDQDSPTVLFERQIKFTEIQNKLMNAIKCLHSKIDELSTLDVPLQKLEIFHHEIKQAQSIISQFDRTVTGLSSDVELAQDLKTLTDQIHFHIQQKQAKAQEELLRECKLKISEHFKQMSLDKLGDPYLFIATQDDISFAGLSDENQFAVNQHIQDECIRLLDNYESKKVTSHMLQQHYKQAEQLFYRLRLGYYRVSTQSEPTPNDLNLQIHYQQLTSQVQKRLDAMFDATNHLPFREQKSRIFELDSTFNQYFLDVEEAAKQVQTAQENQASWLRNPFGWWYTDDTISQLRNSEMAKGDLLESFKKHYTVSLKSYLEQAVNYFGALDYDELINHIQHLQHQLAILKRFDNPDLKEVLQLQEELLEAAKSKEQSHVSHLTDSIESKNMADLKEQVQQLGRTAQLINQTLISNHDFDNDQYENYQALLLQVTTQLKSIKDKIEETDLVHHSYKDQYEDLGKDLHSWDILKKKIEADIESLKCNMNIINNNHHVAFALYAEIAKGNMPEISTIKDKAILGMSLVLAIKYDNKQVIDSLLKPPTQINLQELAVALKEAVKSNNINAVSQILALRPAISSEDIYDCIQSAFKNGNSAIAYYLIFNTEFLPEPSQIDYLKDQAMESDAITGIDSGWRQLIVDTDGATILPDLRNWFLFELQLVDSLKSDLLTVQEKTKHVQPDDNENIDALKSEISQILRKLGKLKDIQEQTKHYLEQRMDRKFDETSSPHDRVNNHFVNWNKELDNLTEDVTSECNHVLGILLSKNVPKRSEIVPDMGDIDNLEMEVLEQDLFEELSDKGVVLPVIDQSMISAASTKISITQAVREIQEKTLETSEDNLNIERAVHFREAQSNLSILLKQSDFSQVSDIEKLDQTLSTLIFNAPTDQLETLGNILSQSLSYLAKSDKIKAIPSLLDAISEPHKLEYARYALTQAIHAGSTNAVYILLLHGAQKGHEMELIDQLWAIYEERQRGDMEKRHDAFPELAFHILSRLSSSGVNPSTKMLDKRIQKMMDTIIKDNANSAMKIVTSTGWLGYFDKDFKKLEDLRKAFVFAESAYDALSKNAESTLQSDFDNVIKERKGLMNLSEIEIDQFENLMNQFEASYGKQLLRIELLTGHYQQECLQQQFDNQIRKEGYIESWEKTQADKLNDTIAKIKDVIVSARKNIQEYRETKKLSEELQQKPKPIVTTRVEPKGLSIPTTKDIEADLTPNNKTSLTK
ncbi:MAG: hypothetical protein HYX61_07410 [Gammaproteobacteria bacterium]|jgi:hypothetical protein|nr:hypothetical protein [Gammaproteobacteria bacterium]